MPQYENSGDFVLFNAKKVSDNSPDFTGYVTIHGVKRRICGWIKPDGRLQGVVGELIDDKPRFTPHPD